MRDIKLVRVMDLVFGDRILLDDGSEVEVKSTELGRHKDAMIIRLRHAQPLHVNGYWEPFIRRTYEAPRKHMREYTHAEVTNMKLGSIVDEMVRIGSNREQAQKFFDAFVKSARVITPGLTEVSAIERVSHNLGYLSGYAPTKIDTKMWGGLGAAHPLFGSTLEGFKPDAEKGECDEEQVDEKR